MYGKSNKGFSLIELMITISIIMILAAVGWPMFQKQQMRQKRSDAYIALTELAQLQERSLSENGSYLSTPPNSASPKGYYELSIDTTCPSGYGDRCYILTATALPGSQFGDTECRTISIDHVGRKTSTDDSGTATTGCWAQ